MNTFRSVSKMHKRLHLLEHLKLTISRLQWQQKVLLVLIKWDLVHCGDQWKVEGSSTGSQIPQQG